MAKMKPVKSKAKYVKRGFHTVNCLICHAGVEVDRDTRAVACGSCVARVIPGPVHKPVKAPPKEPKLTKSGKPRAKRGEGKKYVPSGFPRGWHFKVLYKHTDGKYYSRGKEITAVKAKKLEKELA